MAIGTSYCQMCQKICMCSFCRVVVSLQELPWNVLFHRSYSNVFGIWFFKCYKLGRVKLDSFRFFQLLLPMKISRN